MKTTILKEDLSVEELIAAVQQADDDALVSVIDHGGLYDLMIQPREVKRAATRRIAAHETLRS